MLVAKPISVSYYLTFEVNLLVDFFRKRVAMHENQYNYEMSPLILAIHQTEMKRDQKRLKKEIEFLADILENNRDYEDKINRYISQLKDINCQFDSLNNTFEKMYYGEHNVDSYDPF